MGGGKIGGHEVGLSVREELGKYGERAKKQYNIRARPTPYRVGQWFTTLDGVRVGVQNGIPIDCWDCTGEHF
jgi:hypothetical protein